MMLEPMLAVWLLEHDPGAAASALAGLPVAEIAGALDAVSVPAAARVVQALGPTVAGDLLAQAEIGWAAHLLEELSPAVAAALLARIGLPRRDELLAALPKRLAAVLRQRATYDKNSAAALMDEEAVALPTTLTVRDALQKLRDDGAQVPALFVVDDQQRFVGLVTAEQLLMASPERTLAELMVKKAASISSVTTRSRLLKHPAWQSSVIAAVVDAEGRFLGSLSLGSVLRVADATTRGGQSDPAATSAALGDLFWLGIAGVLGAAAGGEPPNGGR